MERILKEIEKTFTARRILIAFILIVVFFAKEDLIVTVINKTLLVPKGFSNLVLDVLFIIASLCFSFWFIYLFRRRDYKASYVQITSAITITFVILYFFFTDKENKWNYHDLFETNFEYIWLIVISLSTFICFHFSTFLKPVKKAERKLLPNYRLTSDNPKEKNEEELLGYRKVVEELYNILTNQESKKSLTIGLVGPWGNGKSSIIQMLLDKFIPNPYPSNEEQFNKLFKRSLLDDYLIIHFLPYLNHQEEDLISEFFRGLSSQLRPYNGKLSNLVLEYSKRLVNLYKNKIDFNFFDKHISSFEKSSAKEMYDDINKRLEETQKRIIVFVDDLDRLNAKEILQVLKLIRNSADFSNVIFLVAMDKDYITKILMEQGEILNSRFIDKFFQLEVFLPAIQQDVLRTQFKKIMESRTVGFGSDFKESFEFAFENSRNLFGDYIQNMRDVKRVSNQFVYEYPFVRGAIDLKDFMNFVYFKLKYPEFINILKKDHLDWLHYNPDNKELELRELNKEGLFQANLLYRIYNKETLKDYVLYNELDKINRRYYTEEDKVLILKSLSFLFGKHNEKQNTKSIKKVANFNMLMQQRIFEDHLLEEDYTKLFELNSVQLKEYLKELFTQNKLNQLLERLDFVEPKLLGDFRVILETLVFLYDKRVEYNLYDSVLFKKLAQFVDLLLKQLKGTDGIKAIKVLKKYIFENKLISLETRLRLLSELWVAHRYNNLWNLSEKYVIETSLEYYTKFLTEIEENEPWDVNNYTFYHIVINLNKIEPIKDVVVQKTKKFWSNYSIELYCAQTINIEPWSVLGCQISDGVYELFQSKDDFIEFIKNHKDSSLPEIKEFLHFYDLCKRTRYHKIILYTFEKSGIMKAKVEARKNDPQYIREEFRDKKQLLFATNCLEAKNDIKKAGHNLANEDNPTLEYIENENDFTIYLMVHKNYDRNEIESYVKHVLELLKNDGHLNSKISFDARRLWSNEDIIPDDSNYYFKLISEQPKN